MSNLDSSPNYRERVMPRVQSLWPVLLIMPATYLTLLPFNQVSGLVLGPLFCLAAYTSVWFAAPVIEVDETGISVGDATVPFEVVSAVESIAPADAFAERGMRLSPAAYVRFQLGVKGLVKISLEDPADTTPYWLIATRKPESVMNSIAAHRGAN